MDARALNLLVFRDGRKTVSGSELKTVMAHALEGCGVRPGPQSVLAALLRSGEFESALADAGIVSSDASSLTDALAAALLNVTPGSEFSELPLKLEKIPVPATLTVSTHEGFAYYGLHPLAFSRVLEKIQPLPPAVIVAGIRSIGVTLSAVTAAALRHRGLSANRMTVRPDGHPYDRHTEFSPTQLELVREGISRGAGFFIVDEGPGLSGSSFLSVAEALVAAGVGSRDITIICSHIPDPQALQSPNACERWQKFRAVAVPQSPPPTDAKTFIGGGEWRRYFQRDESLWPESWVNFERVKYLSAGASGSRLLKFAGFGHYGESLVDRESTIATGGFGPQPVDEDAGFVSYPLIDGRPMSPSDISESVLARLAAYCAFRAQAFPPANGGTDDLQRMAGHNLQELRFDVGLKLQLERPVLVDGRMQPHEWIQTPAGQMLKTDSGSHGDDHFFPGPADIAWDLAGAMVEWKMNAAQAENFLAMYRRASGDDARLRISDFTKAYTVFRCAWCLMAANALRGSAEQMRLENAAAGYGARLLESAVLLH